MFGIISTWLETVPRKRRNVSAFFFSSNNRVRTPVNAMTNIITNRTIRTAVLLLTTLSFFVSSGRPVDMYLQLLSTFQGLRDSNPVSRTSKKFEILTDGWRTPKRPDETKNKLDDNFVRCAVHSPCPCNSTSQHLYYRREIGLDPPLSVSDYLSPTSLSHRVTEE